MCHFHFSPGRTAIHNNKRVYSPCQCKLVYLGVFVVLGRCGVSVGGEMSHTRNRKRSVLPNGIGGLPEGNNMAGEFITNCVPKNRIAHTSTIVQTIRICPKVCLRITWRPLAKAPAPIVKSTGARRLLYPSLAAPCTHVCGWRGKHLV